MRDFYLLINRWGTIAVADRLGVPLYNVVLWRAGWEPIPEAIALEIAALVALSVGHAARVDAA
jgi:hypothetical protein